MANPPALLTNLDVQYFGSTGSCVVNIAAAAVRLTQCSSLSFQIEEQYRVETFPGSICVTPTVPWSPPPNGRPPRPPPPGGRPPVQTSAPPLPRPVPQGGNGSSVVGSGVGGNGGPGGNGGNVIALGNSNTGRARNGDRRGGVVRPPTGGEGGPGGDGGSVRSSGIGGQGGAGGDGGIVIGSGTGGDGGRGGNGGIVIGSGKGGNGDAGGAGGRVGGRAIGGAGGDGGDGGNALGSGLGGDGGAGGSGGSAVGAGIGGNGGNGGKGGDAIGWFPHDPVTVTIRRTPTPTPRPPVSPPAPGYPVRPPPGYPVGPKPGYPVDPQQPGYCVRDQISVDPLAIKIDEYDIKVHLELLGLVEVNVEIEVSDLLREHADYHRAIEHRYTPRCGYSLRGHPGAQTIPARSYVECVNQCTARAYRASAAVKELQDCLAASYAAAEDQCYVVLGGPADRFDYTTLPPADHDANTYTLDY